ncbi:PTS transporter subunit EIIC [Bacillus siamensis]|uniref:PTS transporter subunit EIIC n=1 Tax=Bacillus siamensis TaxID=659243 RepID=UPI002E23FA6B|nr:PTS transporter subunit EIIC [Bacillus siamensis]MED5049930.1 PTS transporter subunit EIIC [Bacillus siamensis]MED5098426.1 PTS transporter subunit EIIC [Bacillus siamensis]
MLQFLQKLGKSFMLPIAVLPAVGIILAIGREDLLNIPFIYAAGTAVFDHLPLITIILAGIFGFVWPPIQSVITSFGEWMIGLGGIGAGIYGIFNRLLIPFGLHHVLNNIFWFQFGDFHGKTGDLARFFAKDPTAGTYMTGFFPIMMFGLPAACLAMIAAAKPSKRKATAGMMIGLALTAFITGITEPIEFAFMFLSPLLYGVHALLTGFSLFIVNILGIRSGFSFSAGAIDYLISYGIAEKPLLLLVVGLCYAVIYFAVFYVLIKSLNLKTPGREDDEEEEEEVLSEDTAGSVEEHAMLKGLGGRQNLETIDHCATRLRLTVQDTSLINETALKKAGAKGVIKTGNKTAQVIIGPNVEFVAEELREAVRHDSQK